MALTADTLTLACADELLLLELSNGPSYGALMVTNIEQASEYKYSIPPGKLYPKLRKLEKEKLIKECQVYGPLNKSRRGKPPKYYEITDRGRLALRSVHQTRQQLRRAPVMWQTC